ncbi:class I SAM-dependent methyltransferase [Halococcus agarilyticus]|uniref:class I SAM-dependent methyltransferase n=1 Tax=Halococcus agarilyticus TaxID=1232219 RepID=UPI0012AC4DAE|nr:methyltransferase domain-containing protein [Halococcus agarilyticus]
MKQWVNQHAPKAALRVLRPPYRKWKQIQENGQRIWERALFAGHQRGLFELDDIYEESFYARRRQDPWRSDAHNVSEVINSKYSPDSVIDFGCAIGAHLEVFFEDGATVHGVDGNRAAFDHAVIPDEYLEQYDLRNRYTVDHTYDLVLCFELAEHLPEKSADGLVKTLVGAGDTIVMTAATPGQGGTHHVNTQPRKYWIDKFHSQGMTYDEQAVRYLRDHINVEKTTWIPKNLLVFNR